jgi:hypothetical protein
MTVGWEAFDKERYESLVPEYEIDGTEPVPFPKLVHNPNLTKRQRMKNKEHLTVTVVLEGQDARLLRQEAALRGVEIETMAEIFIQQGIFFWRHKS